MASQRIYARSACILIENDANFSKPERSLWHYDQLYAGGLPLFLAASDEKAGTNATVRFDLPSTIGENLNLLTASVFEPQKLNTIYSRMKSSNSSAQTEVCLEVTPRTAISFIFQEYRMVLSIGLAESLFVVSPTSGRIAFDLVSLYVKTLLKQLVSPMVMGGNIQFEPLIHLSVVATTPMRAFICLVQGRVLNRRTHQQIVEHISAQLYALVQRDSFRNVSVDPV